MYSNYIYLLKVLRLSKVDKINDKNYHHKLVSLVNLISFEKEK